MLISQPTFKCCTVLEAIESHLTDMTINKRIYIGLFVLDIPSTSLYDFHYQCYIYSIKRVCTQLLTRPPTLPNKYKYKCVPTDVGIIILECLNKGNYISIRETLFI